MDKDLHRFQEILEDDVGLEVRSYSGRGMYGKRCVGVEVPRGGLGNFIADVMEAVAGSDVDVGVVADAFRSMAVDSMGMDTIVYFTQVPYASDDEGNEEQDEA